MCVSFPDKDTPRPPIIRAFPGAVRDLNSAHRDGNIGA
jgi:hypothetical protein